jgi:hypothetical protein
MKRVSTAALAALMIAATAMAHDVIPENWKACGDPANGVKYEYTTNVRGEPIVITRDQIPSWARSPALRPYYFDDELLLANHGLCNEKFHRVVLCLPGWEDGDSKADWYKVCAFWRANQ